MSKSVEVNGTSLNVIDEGKGAPLLFVHGYPLSAAMWRAQIDAFSATHRVIAPDLRGFGDSDAIEGTVTMEQFAGDLASLLDALDVTEPVTLCGLSMGGYVAFAFWSKYADRLQRLVLTDTRAIGDSPEAAAGRAAMAERVLAEGQTPQVDGMIGKLFCEKTEREQPELVAAVRAIMTNTSPQTMAAVLRAMAQRRDWTTTLPRINTATLVVCGEHDQISPPQEMRGIAGALPDARYVEVPHVGHMAPMENAEAFNTALSAFLSESI